MSKRKEVVPASLLRTMFSCRGGEVAVPSMAWGGVCLEAAALMQGPSGFVDEQRGEECVSLFLHWRVLNVFIPFRRSHKSTLFLFPVLKNNHFFGGVNIFTSIGCLSFRALEALTPAENLYWNKFAVLCVLVSSSCAQSE